MYKSMSSIVNFAEVNQMVTKGGGLKEIAGNFWNELRTLMHDFADFDKDMVINNIHVPAENKYGILGTTLMAERNRQLETMFESSFNVYNTMYDLEKQISRLFGG